jgi:hypothetical protein
VRSALGAGLRALLVTVNDYTAGQDLSDAPFVVDHLGEPDRPARALIGDLGDSRMVDLETLDRLHRTAFGRV